MKTTRQTQALSFSAILIASTPALAATELIADFDGTAAGTVFGAAYPSWRTLSYSPNAVFVCPDASPDHCGVAQATGTEVLDYFVRVSGTTPIAFRRGQKVIATFYNTTEQTRRPLARLSFTDPDSPRGATSAAPWLALYMEDKSEPAVPGHGLVRLVHYITDADTVLATNAKTTAGDHFQINVSQVHWNTSPGQLVLTRLELSDAADFTPPSAPSGLVAEAVAATPGASPAAVRLRWYPATDPATPDDATGVGRYFVYRDGCLNGLVSEEWVKHFGTGPIEYYDVTVVPGKTYTYEVTALDNAPTARFPYYGQMDRRCGNESTAAAVQVTAGAWSSTELLSPHLDLAYLGAFTLPTDGDWGYASGSITYVPEGNPGFDPATEQPGSLYGVGHAHRIQIGEVSIPQPTLTRDPSAMRRARTLQPNVNAFPNAYEVDGQWTWMPAGAVERVARIAYYPGNAAGVGRGIFYGIFWSYSNDRRAPSHGMLDLELTTAAGPWHVGGLPDTPTWVPYELTGKLPLMAPQAWADAHTGGRALLLGLGWAISGRGWPSCGPTFYAVNPLETGALPPANGVLAPAVELLRYGTTNQMQRWERSWNQNTRNDAAVWVSAGGRNAIVISAAITIGDQWYGGEDGTTLFLTDPDLPSNVSSSSMNRGPSASEWRPALKLYDPAALARVASGQAEPWEPQPYAILDLKKYFLNNGIRYSFNGGIAYDPIRRRLFVEEVNGEPGPRSVVHVWQVQLGIGEAGAGDDGGACASGCEPPDGGPIDGGDSDGGTTTGGGDSDDGDEGGDASDGGHTPSGGDAGGGDGDVAGAGDDTAAASDGLTPARAVSGCAGATPPWSGALLLGVVALLRAAARRRSAGSAWRACGVVLLAYGTHACSPRGEAPPLVIKDGSDSAGDATAGGDEAQSDDDDGDVTLADGAVEADGAGNGSDADGHDASDSDANPGDAGSGAGDDGTPSVAAWSFAVMSDIHQEQQSFRAGFDAILAHAAGQPLPDFVILAGDLHLTENLVVLREYPALRFYPVMGNHDDQNGLFPENVTGIVDELLPTLGVRIHERASYVFDWKNATFIVVDLYTAAVRAGDKSWIAWVEEEITSTTKDHVFIAMHQPSFPRHRHAGESLDGYRELWRMLAAHNDKVRAVFVGHTHYYSRIKVRDPMSACAQASTCFPVEPDGVWEIQAGSPHAGDCDGRTTVVLAHADGADVRYSAISAGEDRLFSVRDEWGRRDDEPPSPPSATSALPIATSYVDVSWSGAADDLGVAGYLVSRDGDDVGTSYGRSFLDATVPIGGTVTYTVRAFDEAGNLSSPSGGTGTATATAGQALTSRVPIAHGDRWDYQLFDADPEASWTQPSYAALGWQSGPSPFGFGGYAGVATDVAAMRNSHSTIYLRKTFSLTAGHVANVRLELNFDDGFVAYLNGVEVARANIYGAPSHVMVATGDNDASKTVVYDLTPAREALVAGDNTLSVVVFNERLDQGTLFFNAALTLVGRWP